VTGGVGPDEFLRQLAAEGLSVAVEKGIATFSLTVPIGSRIGEDIRVGLQVPPDFPLSPPPGPHLSPIIPHPDGAVHDSPLGKNWCYWSRPFRGWAQSSRTVREYMAHVRNLLAQL